MSEEHVGVIRISLKQLHAALHLPEGMKVRGVIPSDFGRSLKLLVESDMLPAVQEGCEVSEVGEITVWREMQYDEANDKWWERTELRYVP